MGNTWRYSPWTETDGKMAGGGGLWRPAAVRGGVGFQWVSGDGKGQRRCGSARRSSGRCSLVGKIDRVSKSAWQHRRRRSEFDGDGASARMGVCRCVSGVERGAQGIDFG
jgi:hypothetical protein